MFELPYRRGNRNTASEFRIMWKVTDVLLKTKAPRFERHPTGRSLEELTWTAQLIQQVAQAIETHHFYPNPSWRCSECEYFAHCQAWRGEEGPPAELIQISH
jgi:hypothetical protein